MISFRPNAWLRIVPTRAGDAQERDRQRATRRQQALERAGRDEQHLERAPGHTYLVFRDRAAADEVLREIAATPILPEGLEWPVQIWDEDAGAGIGTFEAVDGRVALGHPWASTERAWLAAYLDGWRVVQILAALPADWRPKEGEPSGG